MAKKETIKKINRILLILNKLNDGHINLYEISQELNVSLRSIQRDIRLIEDAGFPLYSLGSKEYAFVEGFSLKKTQIDEKEASLLVMMSEFSSTLGSNFESIFKNLKQKLISANPAQNPFYIKIQKGTDYLQNETLKTVESAIKANEIIKIIYPIGSKPEYIVKPLKIAWIDGFWYLLTLGVKNHVLKFRTKEITSAVKTGKTFKPVKDIEKLIKDGTNIWFDKKRNIDIKLSVPVNCAEFFKAKQYFPLQKIEKENKDGSLIISCKAARYEEVLSTIMHWIPNLKVLQPQELANKVKETVRNYYEQL
jgi:predicted DNA-binding transcriptional regulator YafY